MPCAGSTRPDDRLGAVLLDQAPRLRDHLVRSGHAADDELDPPAGDGGRPDPVRRLVGPAASRLARSSGSSADATFSSFEPLSNP